MSFKLPYPVASDSFAIQRNFDAIALAMNPPVPQARVYNSGAISIPNITLTALTFDSERYDSGSLHSTSANTSRLTAPVTGLYNIGGNVEFASNATGYRILLIRFGGSSRLAQQMTMALTGDVTCLNVTAQYRMLVGEYVELCVYQSSGGALNVSTQTAWSPEFWMHRVAGYEGGQFT